jgi:hypothetical protein
METLDRVLDRLSRSSIELAIAICPSSSAHWIEEVAAESESCVDSPRRLAWSLGGLLYSMRLAFPALLLDLLKHRGGIPSLASAALFSWLFLVLPGYFVAASLLDSSGILHWPFAPIEAFVGNDALRPWFNAISPIVLLGSLSLSVYISLFSFLRAREFRAAMVRETSAYAMNVGALVAGVVLVATLVAYAYLENGFRGAAQARHESVRAHADSRVPIILPFEAMTFA